MLLLTNCGIGFTIQSNLFLEIQIVVFNGGMWSIYWGSTNEKLIVNTQIEYYYVFEINNNKLKVPTLCPKTDLSKHIVCTVLRACIQANVRVWSVTGQ